MKVSAASQWQVLRIGDHDGCVSRGRWAWGINDDNVGVNWGSRRYNASKWMSLLLPQPTPTLSLSRPWDHLPLSTPPTWSPIPQAHHRNTASSAVVPKSPISQTHRIFLVLRRRLRCRSQFCGPVSERLLTFGLLTSYFFWWHFALVTVGRAILPNLVGNNNVENSWGAN